MRTELDAASEDGSSTRPCEPVGGTVELVGLGLKRARAAGIDPVTADLVSCLGLARALDELSGGVCLDETVVGGRSAGQVARAMRKRDAHACAGRANLVARALRAHFLDEISRRGRPSGCLSSSETAFAARGL